MIKKANLTLVGCQKDESGAETVTETRTEADYSEKDGRHYVLYEEKQEETENTDKNTIIIRDGLLEMRRNGSIRSHMIFEPEKTHKVNYVTPYGTLQLEVFTKKLDISIRDIGIKASLEYTLTSGGQLLSDCALTVSLDFS